MAISSGILIGAAFLTGFLVCFALTLCIEADAYARGRRDGIAHAVAEAERGLGEVVARVRCRVWAGGEGQGS